MIKTIQYLAEADNSRVLVALNLKAAFQNVSRSSMLYSIAETDADLAAVFSKWYTGTTEHRMHHDSVYTKISANSGVDQGCPLSAGGFSVEEFFLSGGPSSSAEVRVVVIWKVKGSRKTRKIREMKR